MKPRDRETMLLQFRQAGEKHDALFAEVLDENGRLEEQVASLKRNSVELHDEINRLDRELKDLARENVALEDRLKVYNAATRVEVEA